MRRGVRVVVVLALLLASSLCLSGSASASQRAVPGLDCKSAPTPTMPGRGITGFFQSPPKDLPPDADPFADNAPVSIYEVYGYAGLSWNTYDLGCGSDLARNPEAVAFTGFANSVDQVSQVLVAATSATLGAAYDPTFLGVFDPLIAKTVTSLQVGVFEHWLYLVIGAIGLFLIWMSNKQRASESASAIGWALLVMVLATMVFRWPLVAGHAADQLSTAVLASVNDGLNGSSSGSSSADQAAAAHMHESLLYDTWLAGTFGSADSATAKEYGPKIFASTALTWREAAVLQSNPDEGKKIIEAKGKAFEDAADEIKSADPDAYENLTGKRSYTRVGFAFLSIFGALFVVPFLLVAGLLIIGALIIVRMGVSLFPLFATLGMFPTMRILVTGLGSTVAAALINSCIFGAGASVTVLFMGAIMSSASIPGWLSILLMLIVTIVMWVALSPFRRLTLMVSPGDMQSTFRDGIAGPGALARTAGRLGAKGAMAVATGGAGAAAGILVADQVREDAAPHRAESDPDPVRVTTQVVPSTPASDRPAAALPATVAPGREIESGAVVTAAPAQPMPPTPRPGDDGAPVEGVVLPPTRFEMEDV